MKHLLIINPAAGGRDQSSEIRLRAAELLYGQDCEVYVTKAPMDAADKVREEAKSGEQLRVYACGGDGTLNECVNGAALMPNVAVTHYPCGTGNDFIKMFGNEDSELFFNLESLISGFTRDIDVIQINGRYGVNICSAGMDARIGTDVHKYSGSLFFRGKGGYIASTAVNFFKGVNQNLRVRCGDFEWSGPAALVCACNGRWYGGGFHAMPDAMPDDGILDFLIVRDVSRLTFLKLVGKYAKGRYRELPKHITHLRGTQMDIEADENLAAQVDGEAISAKNLSVRLIPRGLRFFFPNEMSFFGDTDLPKNQSNTQN